MANNKQIDAIGLAWRNTLMNTLGAERGKATFAVVQTQLQPGIDDEALLTSVRFALQRQDIGFAVTQELMRKLSADYYAGLAHDSALDAIGHGSAFESMETLLSALEAGASQLDAVLAGKVEPPDISGLLDIQPDQLEAEAVRLGAQPEVAEQLVSNFWKRLSELVARQQLQRATKRIKLDAMVKLLDECRLANVY